VAAPSDTFQSRAPVSFFPHWPGLAASKSTLTRGADEDDDELDDDELDDDDEEEDKLDDDDDDEDELDDDDDEEDELDDEEDEELGSGGAAPTSIVNRAVVGVTVPGLKRRTITALAPPLR